MNLKNEFAFTGAATYRICVEGRGDSILENLLGGMKISQIQTRRNLITSIEGELLDQAALNGVLNTLFNLHYYVISVNKIEDPNS